MATINNDEIKQDMISGYSDVNGLKMYYEIHGQGKPLVLIHGGGSSIQVTFSGIIPLLAKHRQIIAMDLQAHGRTNDRDTYLTFEQDANDVAQLLKNLRIIKADFLGFSNGGQTVLEIALRHPDLINKIIICSAFYKRSAVVPGFWEGFDHVDFSMMPQQFKDEFLKVNNNPSALRNMFDKDVQRMKTFKGWTDEQIQSIQAPAFIMNGDQDVGSAEHAVEMFRMLPHAKLAILPGAHGEFIGEINPAIEHSVLPEITVSLVEKFLNEPMTK
jgi:pimeloyl-ACP methyl ester carboxylesterase